ncbi:MAG: D-tyrosyl-tRNA(Tyr) deacylase [Xanthomonadaceae bacterium]|nr:D-tyrosyl-tRNA(Tyr) deacylase [Xanthomonadaceae bacterium]
MRAVIQRVKWAKVTVEGAIIGEIQTGIMTLLGIGAGDTLETAKKILTKINALRIFTDEAGKMNLSLSQVGGAHLIISQFTLYGDTSSGNRPSFIKAKKPEAAERLYLEAVAFARTLGTPVETGPFQADMKVELLNDGPVTLIIESEAHRELS